MKTTIAQLKEILDGSGIYLDKKLYSDFMEKEKIDLQKAYSQGRVDEETRFPYATDEVDYYNSTFGDSNEAGI